MVAAGDDARIVTHFVLRYPEHINARTRHGATLLHHVMALGLASCASALLAAGADAAARAPDAPVGETPRVWGVTRAPHKYKYKYKIYL